MVSGILAPIFAGKAGSHTRSERPGEFGRFAFRSPGKREARTREMVAAWCCPRNE